MAFWGVEIKPGKPYTHRYDETRGRLRVTQATLGNLVKAKDVNPAAKHSRTTVQCNVGEKSPVLICILVSDKCETCNLDLEFEEQEEVVFSVLGQTSVHLTGYYVGSRDGSIEPIGEDIAETESENSDYDDLSEEDYESDFIDDGDDIEMYDDDDDNVFAPSRPRKSGVVIEEIIDEEKPSNGDKSRLAKKKNRQISDSDDAAIESQSQLTVAPTSVVQVDSEDEDGFPISESKKNEASKEESKKRKSDDAGKGDGAVEEVNGKIGEDNEVSRKKKKLDKKSKKTKKSQKESQAEDVAQENAPQDGKKSEEETKEEPTKVDAELEETPVSKKISEIENGHSTDTSESKKKKKKKKKNKESGEKDQGKKEENEEKDEKKEAQQTRTFGNGLVVEEISMGRPDGKKANQGSKVFVNYIGKLQNGKIFDSNVGQKPFKFRLGVGQVIKGWDVGVNGMRVGDKRRLTIPPSMGYRDKAVGKIPKNSWLIFDVELVNVQ